MVLHLPCWYLPGNWHYQQWREEEEIEKCVHSGLGHNCKRYQISEFSKTSTALWDWTYYRSIKLERSNNILLRNRFIGTDMNAISPRCNIVIEDRIEHEIYLKYNQIKWINHWNKIMKCIKWNFKKSLKYICSTVKWRNAAIICYWGNVLLIRL